MEAHKRLVKYSAAFKLNVHCLNPGGVVHSTAETVAKVTTQLSNPVADDTDNPFLGSHEPALYLLSLFIICIAIPQLYLF